jgi:hypothetical protein
VRHRAFNDLQVLSDGPTRVPQSSSGSRLGIPLANYSRRSSPYGIFVAIGFAPLEERTINTQQDLLLDFEKGFPDHYREYHAAKQNDFFATIQAAPRFWSAFMLLDKIWLREYEDMRTIIDTDRMFPMFLFMNAHSKIRVG